VRVQRLLVKNTNKGEGSWQIKELFNGDGQETYYVHNCPSYSNSAIAGNGCIGIAGARMMVNFNLCILGLAGTSNGCEVNAVINFLPAAIRLLSVAR